MVFDVLGFSFFTGFGFFLSTFFLDAKSGAKKSRTAQSLRVPVGASAQQPVISG
jgi:hypothetical protein